MMSIGTLMAYSVVAICVLILRYRPSAIDKDFPQSEELIKKPLSEQDETFTLKEMWDVLLKPPKVCCNLSSKVVNWLSLLASI